MAKAVDGERLKLVGHAQILALAVSFAWIGGCGSGDCADSGQDGDADDSSVDGSVDRSADDSSVEGSIDGVFKDTTAVDAVDDGAPEGALDAAGETTQGTVTVTVDASLHTTVAG